MAHPTWAMGPKITIDSSTLMNKGLEVIEAHELFDADYDDIDVVVHPQSIVHSMPTFTDGATIAQLSMPDMRLPIAYALAYPDRLEHAVRRDRLLRRRSTSSSSRPTERPSRASTWRTRRAGAAGRRRRGCRPPTRSRSRRSSPVASAGVEIAEANADALDGWDGTAANDVDAVLAADAAARVVATSLVEARR